MHVAGQHRVDRDGVRGQLDGGGAHEAELPGLARAVVRPAGEAGDRPGDGGGQDDPAVRGLLQRGQAGLDGQDAAAQVGAEHGVQVLVGHVGEPLVREDPRVGAQHVDAAQPLGRGRRDQLAALPDADVGQQVGDVGPARGQFRDGRRGRVLVPPDDQDPRAVVREHPGDALADAPGGAGDHDGPPRDRCEHVKIPSVLALTAEVALSQGAAVLGIGGAQLPGDVGRPDASRSTRPAAAAGT